MAAGLPPSYGIDVSSLPLTTEVGEHRAGPFTCQRQLRVASPWSLCSSWKPIVGCNGMCDEGYGPVYGLHVLTVDLSNDGQVWISSYSRCIVMSEIYFRPHEVQNLPKCVAISRQFFRCWDLNSIFGEFGSR